MILNDIPQLLPPSPVVMAPGLLQRSKSGRESRPGSVGLPNNDSPQATRPPSTISVAKSAGPERKLVGEFWKTLQILYKHIFYDNVYVVSEPLTTQC